MDHVIHVVPLKHLRADRQLVIVPRVRVHAQLVNIEKTQ